MRVALRIKGQVQGVGYRYFVVRTAKKFSLTGWVKNCSNGDVESQAQGDEKNLKNFLGELEKGHSWAQVDKIRQELIPEKIEEKEFEIVC